MKKLFIPIIVATLAVSGAVLAGPVRDWKDLHAVHEKVQNAIKDLEKARAANHYDMKGHGAKAEQLLREAEKELHEAVEAAKEGK
jgi:hypothetical protein